MKFMQRASTGTNAPPQTPSSEPSLKRRKTDHTPDSSNPTTPASEPHTYASKSDVRAALRVESAFEALAASRRAELGFGKNDYETQWVLDVRVPIENDAHNAGDDESDDSEDVNWAEANGRQTYGAFKRKKKTSATTPSSGQGTPGNQSGMIDLDSDGNDLDEDEEEGEYASDSDEDTSRLTPSQSKKKKAQGLDLTNDAAMSALDRVDLSKSSYAKLKGTNAQSGRKFDYGGGRRDKRGDKHPKNKNSKNKAGNQKKKR